MPKLKDELITFRPEEAIGNKFLTYVANLGVEKTKLAERAFMYGLEKAYREMSDEKRAEAERFLANSHTAGESRRRSKKPRQPTGLDVQPKANQISRKS